MADLWTDYTDALIDSIDSSMGSKYKVSLRELLTNPNKFSKMSNISTTIANIKEETDKYITNAIDSMPDESKALRDILARCDSITNTLAQSVSNIAKQNKLPLIRPALVDRDVSIEETIYVVDSEQSTLALIAKLCENSLFVSDFTETYKEHNMGEWLFSGQKNYVVSVYVQPNEVLSLDASKDELDALIDSVAILMTK